MTRSTDPDIVWTTQPNPCDGCGYRKACADGPLACDRFVAYVTNRRWDGLTAEPTAGHLALLEE